MHSKPTYKASHKSYDIDSCAPQHQAIREGKIDFCALTKGHYPGMTVPENILPGLSSIGFWNAAVAQDWGLEFHRNEGIEIMFLETGTVAFWADQKKYTLRAGAFTVTRPWQLHKVGAPNIGPSRLHWFILDVGVRRPSQEWRWPKWVVLAENDLAELTRKLRRNENPVWTSTPAIAQAFRGVADSVKDWRRPHAISRMAVNLNQLLVGILDALSEQQTQEDVDLTSRRRTVELFLRDLEQELVNPGEPWTLDRMAEHCGMGVTTFSKYCRELVNAGPMEFLNRCRLDRAARELRERRDHSITEIALANGFNSSQYFATRFRQRFHVSPSQFLENAKTA